MQLAALQALAEAQRALAEAQRTPEQLAALQALEAQRLRAPAAGSGEFRASSPSKLFLFLLSLPETLQNFVSVEALIPVFWGPLAVWVQGNPYVHFLFSTGFSIGSFGLSSCPRLWVPLVIGICKCRCCLPHTHTLTHTLTH